MPPPKMKFVGVAELEPSTPAEPGALRESTNSLPPPRVTTPPKLLVALVSFHTPVPVLVRLRRPAPLSASWPARIFGSAKVPPEPPRTRVEDVPELGRMTPVLVMFKTAPEEPEASKPPLTLTWKSLLELWLVEPTHCSVPPPERLRLVATLVALPKLLTTPPSASVPTCSMPPETDVTPVNVLSADRSPQVPAPFLTIEVMLVVVPLSEMSAAMELPVALVPVSVSVRAEAVPPQAMAPVPFMTSVPVPLFSKVAPPTPTVKRRDEVDVPVPT